MFDKLCCTYKLGGPSSGKTTQLENAAKRFNLTTLDAKKQDLKKEIEKLVNDGGKSSGGNNEKKEKIRVIIEGFPKTIEQANKFQHEVGHHAFNITKIMRLELITLKLDILIHVCVCIGRSYPPHYLNSARRPKRNRQSKRRR